MAKKTIFYARCCQKERTLTYRRADEHDSARPGGVIYNNTDICSHCSARARGERSGTEESEYEGSRTRSGRDYEQNDVPTQRYEGVAAGQALANPHAAPHKPSYYERHAPAIKQKRNESYDENPEPQKERTKEQRTKKKRENEAKANEMLRHKHGPKRDDEDHSRGSGQDRRGGGAAGGQYVGLSY